MSTQLTGVVEDLLSKRKALALRNEMKKPDEKRRSTEEVTGEVMEDWLFQTPVIERSELAERRRPNFKGRGGTQFDPSNLRKAFNRLLDLAGLRRVRFHDLRHTFASLLIQNGESLAYGRDHLGHSSSQITVDGYGHLTPGGNRQAVDRLDDVSERRKEAVSA
jgi:integrase